MVCENQIQFDIIEILLKTCSSENNLQFNPAIADSGSKSLGMKPMGCTSCGKTDAQEGIKLKPCGGCLLIWCVHRKSDVGFERPSRGPCERAPACTHAHGAFSTAALVLHSLTGIALRPVRERTGPSINPRARGGIRSPSQTVLSSKATLKMTPETIHF